MSSSQSPGVSVCIPSYNAALTIRETLATVLTQTMSDFEVVVADDGSSDSTLRAVKGFNDPRVRILPPTQRAGMAENWNRAVMAARGRWIKVLGHDDLLYPNCLAEQMAVLEDPKNAGVALVGCRRDIVDAEGRPVLRGRGLRRRGRVDGRAAIRAVVRSGTNPIGEPVAVMFRADAFADTSGFNGKSPYMIDVDLWCRLLEKGDLFFIRQTLCAFRVSKQSVSAQIAKDQAAQAKTFFKSLQERSDGSISRMDLRLGLAKATVLAHGRRMAYAWMWGGRKGIRAI